MHSMAAPCIRWMQFFCEMADRQAALCEQQALEASLLRQATAAIWSARGSATGKGAGVGPLEALTAARTNPLGPRLAWLACEELTSFFQHNASSNSSVSSDVGSSPSGSPASLLQPPMRRNHTAAAAAARRRGLIGRTDSLSLSSAFGGGIGVGGTSGGDDASLVARRDEVMKKAVARMELNLLLPGGAHRGTLFDPASPCGFCGLALALCPSVDGGAGNGCCSDRDARIIADGASRGGNIDGAMAFRPPPGSVLRSGDDVDVDDMSKSQTEVVVKVKACGHGYHSRCLASASAGDACWRGGGGGGGRGRGEGELLHLPCPQCS